MRDPAVTLAGDGRFTVRVVVDLDHVRGTEARALWDPLRYLSGRVPLVLVAALRASGGRGVLEFVSATAAGVAVPRVVVQEIVVYATRSPETPQGVRFDEPFVLPANIRDIVVGSGQVTVIQ